MIGAALYSEIYPLIQDKLLMLGDYGKLTVPALLGVDPWYVIVPMVIAMTGVLIWLDRKGM